MTEVRIHSVAEFIVELAKHKPRNGVVLAFFGDMRITSNISSAREFTGA